METYCNLVLIKVIKRNHPESRKKTLNDKAGKHIGLIRHWTLVAAMAAAMGNYLRPARVPFRCKSRKELRFNGTVQASASAGGIQRVQSPNIGRRPAFMGAERIGRRRAGAVYGYKSAIWGNTKGCYQPE